MADTLGHVLDELNAVPSATVQPVHADLHVGQILRWRDGLAVIDFEGNPTPGIPGTGLPSPPPGTSPSCCAASDTSVG
jgi:predicted trehalose synthase